MHLRGRPGPQRSSGKKALHVSAGLFYKAVLLQGKTGAVAAGSPPSRRQGLI